MKSKLLDDADLRTTQIYLHASADGATAETSPLDRLPRIAENAASRSRSEAAPPDATLVPPRLIGGRWP